MPSTATLVTFRTAPRAARAAGSHLYPLDRAYAVAGLMPPSARVIAPDEMPPPYRSLLVHDDDMTRALEGHAGGPLVIRPLCVTLRTRWYLRRVLLVHASSGRPCGMGAVRGALDAFSARVRNQIVHGEVPLGRVLRDGRLAYRRETTALLAIEPNAEMMGVFWMRAPQTLYGRQTVLTLKGVRIGQVVDVLPGL